MASRIELNLNVWYPNRALSKSSITSHTESLGDTFGKLRYSCLVPILRIKSVAFLHKEMHKRNETKWFKTKSMSFIVTYNTVKNCFLRIFSHYPHLVLWQCCKCCECAVISNNLIRIVFKIESHILHIIILNVSIGILCIVLDFWK